MTKFSILLNIYKRLLFLTQVYWSIVHQKLQELV